MNLKIICFETPDNRREPIHIPVELSYHLVSGPYHTLPSNLAGNFGGA